MRKYESTIMFIEGLLDLATKAEDIEFLTEILFDLKKEVESE